MGSSNRTRGSLRVAWVTLLLLGLAAPQAALEDASPTRRALLIGINDYIAVPDLGGAINDVEMISQLLTTRFGFPEENIELVTNRQATREGILAAIDRLVESSGPGDVVYLHFSGHGSQVSDLNGDEEDGADETLVPHDGRTEGVMDITDDELAGVFARLKGRTAVIVLDSCHSGTATRAVDPGRLVMQSRRVPPDDRVELYRRPTTRAVVPLLQSDHVLMTAAAHNESALDGPVDGRIHGIFTYALARSLGNAPPDVSPRGIFDGVERELERIKAQLGLRSMPEPQLEAVADRMDAALLPPPGTAAVAPVGAAAADAATRLPWLEAKPEKQGRVRLVKGTRLGAVPGSIWAIYPPGEREFPPGHALAEAKVTKLDGVDALAKLEPADARVTPKSRATAVAPAPSAKRVPVRLNDTDGARAKRLRKAIQQRLDAVNFVGDGEFARFAVELDQGNCSVYGADGLYEIAAMEIVGEEQLATALAEIFARSMTAAELLSLDNPASSLKLELAVTAALAKSEREEKVRSTVLLANTTAPVFRIRRSGQPRTLLNSLQLRARASAACYLTLVDVDSEGHIVLLFPNAISEKRGYIPDGYIANGQAVLIPDSLESGNRAGFHVDYAPPSGTDTIRAFCSTERAPAATLRAAIASLGEGTDGVGDNSDPARVEQVRQTLDDVRGVLTSTAARGLSLVADEPVPAPAAVAAPGPGSANPAAPEAEKELSVVSSFDWAAASVTVQVAE